MPGRIARRRGDGPQLRDCGPGSIDQEVHREEGEQLEAEPRHQHPRVAPAPPAGEDDHHEQRDRYGTGRVRGSRQHAREEVEGAIAMLRQPSGRLHVGPPDGAAREHLRHEQAEREHGHADCDVPGDEDRCRCGRTRVAGPKAGPLGGDVPDSCGPRVARGLVVSRAGGVRRRARHLATVTKSRPSQTSQ